MKRALALGLLWLGGGCASEGGKTAPPVPPFPTPGAPFAPPPAAVPPPAGPIGLDRLAAGPEVLAEVAGKPLTQADLGAYLCVAEPALARQLLDDLVKLELLRREIRRLGVVVPERLVAARLAAAVSRVEAEARRRGLTREAYVARRLGVSWPGFLARERVLIRTALYRERVVRFAALLRDRVAARILVVSSREEAERLRERLARGGDFPALARLHSRHPSAARGGEIPPLARWGVEPALEDLLFRLAPGEVGGPVPVGAGEEQAYALVQCLRRLPARRLSYAEARAEVERSLKAIPLSALEYEGWVAALEKRYAVKLRWDRVPPGGPWPGKEGP